MKKCSFLGAGNMASAIIGGMGEEKVCLFDVNPAQYEKFKGDRFTFAASVRDALAWGDYIFLCVKPQNFEDLFCSVREQNCPLDGKVFVSIAAGVSTDAVCRMAGRTLPVIRTMPNTPLLIGKGVTALSRNASVSDADFAAVQAMFSTCGETFVLPEDKMNAVIAATSSAPAYVFLLIRAITEEAGRQGLDGNEMIAAVASMVSGSAQLVLQSGKTPSELIDMVTSPHGTTEQAMRVFAENDFSGIVAKAMQACTRRAEELGK